MANIKKFEEFHLNESEDENEWTSSERKTIEKAKGDRWWDIEDDHIFYQIHGYLIRLTISNPSTKLVLTTSDDRDNKDRQLSMDYIDRKDLKKALKDYQKTIAKF